MANGVGEPGNSWSRLPPWARFLIVAGSVAGVVAIIGYLSDRDGDRLERDARRLEGDARATGRDLRNNLDSSLQTARDRAQDFGSGVKDSWNRATR